MKQHIQRLLRQKWALPAATGVVGFGVGVVIGYASTKSQYDKLEAMLEEFETETANVEAVTELGKVFSHLSESQKQDLSRMMKEYNAADMRDLVQRHPSYSPEMSPTHLDEKRSAVRGERIKVDLDPLEEKGKAVVSNIFSKRDDEAGDEWDYKTEIQARDRSKPYIIHIDEFLGDEKGYGSQATLTWYEKDQILCDSHDKPIYNHNDVVGELIFGHGSNDSNVVYIRNEQLEAEFEVIRDEGSYEEIVLGEQMEKETQAEELRHSHQMRFRPD